MMVNSAQYTLAFSGMDFDEKETRRKFEDALKSYRFTMFALRKAPADVPRMVGVTEHGHAQIQMSNSRAHIRIFFDEAYRSDVPSCFSYVKGKISELEEAFRAHASSIRSPGILMRYNFPEDSVAQQIAQGKILAWKLGGKLYDVGARFCLIKDQQYFVNVSLEQIHVAEGDPLDGKISIVVDINHRYAEEVLHQPMTVQTTKNLLLLHKEIAERKLERLLSEGRFDCDDGTEG